MNSGLKPFNEKIKYLLTEPKVFWDQNSLFLVT